MAIELIAKIAPKNDGFTGMVDADQVLGGNGSGTLPDACVAASNVSQHPPKVHKDSHDPEDGSDALDCAAAAEIAGVQAAGEGSAHTLARSDHDHQIQHGIADNHLVTVDDADAADDDYAKFTTDGLEGRSYAEVLSDLSNQATSNFRFPTTIKLEFRDADIFIHSDADGNLKIEADNQVTIGVAGYIDLGDSTLRVARPQTDEKIDLGDATHRFHKGYFTDVVSLAGACKLKVTTMSMAGTDPTDAELDSNIGQPSAMGNSYTQFVKKSGTDDHWQVLSDGTNWHRTAKWTKL